MEFIPQNNDFMFPDCRNHYFRHCVFNDLINVGLNGEDPYFSSFFNLLVLLFRVFTSFCLTRVSASNLGKKNLGTFLATCAYQGVRDHCFRKTWCALFSCYLRFKIRLLCFITDELWLKPYKFHQYKFFGSTTIAPEENCPATLKLTQTLTPTGVEAILFGGNCPDTKFFTL